MATNTKRVACVGASITFGLGLANRREECYPAVLGQLLGQLPSKMSHQVRNFGYSGATAGRATNEPYWDTPSFTAATRFDPEIVLLAFGTNDAQHVNRSSLTSFEDDFIALLEHFRKLPAEPSIMVALPMPVFDPLPDIDISTLDNTIRPAIERIATTLGHPLIDAYTPFQGRNDLFPDNLHPNAEGARLLANLALESMQTAGLVG